jgi:hypothetical protein
MHMIINALVVAKSAEEAVEKASEVFERITGDGQPFDYYEVFDNPGSPVSGAGRWGEQPAALKIGTNEGNKALADAMAATRRDFMDALKRVKRAIRAFKDEELYQGKTNNNLDKKKDYDLSLFRFACYQVGQYKGSQVWVYDQDGAGIREDQHLQRALSNWDQPIPDVSAVWIVPADVHY